MTPLSYRSFWSVDVIADRIRRTGVGRAEEREHQPCERRLRPKGAGRPPEGRAVASAAERSRAEAIARRAVGTSGTVANELTVKGVDQRTADDHDGDIRRVLKDKVDNDPTLNDRPINFDVSSTKNGRSPACASNRPTRLSGRVPSRKRTGR